MKIDFDTNRLERLLVGSGGDERISEQVVLELFAHPEILNEVEGGSVGKTKFLALVMNHLVDCEECRKKVEKVLQDLEVVNT